MDSVFIRNLSLRGKHGVKEEERQVEQEFLLDIEADIDTRKAAESDDLSDTANYSVFRDAARDAVEKNSFLLIERLGDRIAQSILADTRIQRVRITIKKPAVWTNGLPGITIERTQ